MEIRSSFSGFTRMVSYTMLETATGITFPEAASTFLLTSQTTADFCEGVSFGRPGIS
jgi:hypothetical protein